MRSIRKFLRNHVTTVKLFGIIALASGVYFVVFVPPFFGLDEAAHLKRVHQISEGNITSSIKGSTAGGYVPETFTLIEKYSQEARKSKDLSNNTSVLNETYKLEISKKNVFSGFPGSAAYSPIAYSSALPGYFIARFFDLNFGVTLLLTRLSSLLAFVTIIALALRTLQFSRLKWVIVVVALWPKTIFQASVVSADSLVIAFALLIFALFAKVFVKGVLSRYELLMMIVAAIILPLVKFNYIFLSMCILLLSNHVFEVLKINFIKSKYIKYIAASFTLLFMAAWLYIAQKYSATINPDAVNVLGQIKYILINPIGALAALINTFVYNGVYYTVDYMNTMVGRLGYNFASTPVFTILSGWILLLIAGLYGKKDIRNKKPFIIASLLAVTAAIGIFFTLYVTFTSVGASAIAGMQGRYFLPLIPYFIVVVSTFLPISVTISHKHVPMIFLGGSIMNLLIAAYYYHLLTFIGIA